jgi:hypothetical protein
MAKKEEIVNEGSRRRADEAAARQAGVKVYSDGPTYADGREILKSKDPAAYKRWVEANRTYKANQGAQNKAEAGFMRRDKIASERKTGSMSSRFGGGPKKTVFAPDYPGAIPKGGVRFKESDAGNRRRVEAMRESIRRMRNKKNK